MRFGVQGYIYSYLVRPFYLFGPALLELSRSLYHPALCRGAQQVSVSCARPLAAWRFKGLVIVGSSVEYSCQKPLRLRLSRPTVVRVNAPEKKTANAILVDPAM